MRKEEFYYDSVCNTNKIHAVKWVPEGTPLCIIQIVHGMSEYIERYEEFASFLTEKNILVVGEDHLGHGKSMGNNPPGYFCKEQPHTVLVENVHKLKDIIKEEYPDIPYVVFGHSMGSFITRNFIHQYGTEIDGAVICGTGMLPNALIQAMEIVYQCEIEEIDEFDLDEIEIAAHSLKFGSDQFRLGRRIPFTWEVEQRFDWGGIELQCEVESGQIKNALIYSDALDNGLIEAMASALQNCAFGSKPMTERLQQLSQSWGMRQELLDVCRYLQELNV